jgi:uncharacterized protein with PIN domain
MTQEIRFLADDMVGRLARWLRILGYDTWYANPLPDDRLAEIARRENRAVLTRHAALTGLYPDLEILVLDEENPWIQLREVVRRFQLDTESGLFFTRCSVCNGLLESIDKTDYRDQIPPKSYEAFDEFWRCPDCGKLYWEGTHVSRMREQLEWLRNAER